MVHIKRAAMDQQFRTVSSTVHWSLKPVLGSRRMGTFDLLYYFRSDDERNNPWNF